jgi:hypothetical protein
MKTQQLKTCLEFIHVVLPELWDAKNASQLTRLIGVFQLSKVYAMGFSSWCDEGFRYDRLVYEDPSNTYQYDHIRNKLDLRELTYEEAPEVSIWLVSYSPYWGSMFLTDFVVWK